MAAVIAYTLPTIQLVCHLVALLPPGNNFTDSVPATTESSPQMQAPILPDGYIAYPEIGFAYKYHESDSTWEEARDCCQREGAALAVIDSLKKMEYIGRQKPSQWFHAGIILSDESETWINANTRDPIERVIWAPHEPTYGGRCLQFRSSAHGLANWDCDNEEEFVCQIPISLKSTITVK